MKIVTSVYVFSVISSVLVSVGVVGLFGLAQGLICGGICCLFVVAPVHVVYVTVGRLDRKNKMVLVMRRYDSIKSIIGDQRCLVYTTGRDWMIFNSSVMQKHGNHNILSWTPLPVMSDDGLNELIGVTIIRELESLPTHTYPNHRKVN